MSSEREEDSPAIWHDSDTSWDESFDPYETSPRQGNQSFTEEEDEDLPDPPLLSWEGLQRIGRRFSYVIVPLLFALVIWMITLPFTIRDAARVPLIPMIFLLVALAVAQGTALYFASSDDNLWSLCVIVGFCLFVLLGSYVIFGIGFSFILFILLFVLGILMARRSIRVVPEGRVDIVHAFGKYKQTLYPGFHLLRPWERVSSELNVRETFWTSPKERVSIMQEQEVEIIATLSYQLMPEDAHLAVFHVKDWENSLHELFITTVHHDVHELSPEDFTAPHRKSHQSGMPDPSTARLWDLMNTRLWRHMQDQVAHWGVQVNWVKIVEMHLLPGIPTKVDVPAAGFARPMGGGTTRGAGQSSAQPSHASAFPQQQFGRAQFAQSAPVTSSPERVSAAPANPSQPAPASASASQSDAASSEAKNQALIDAYDAVRNGRIMDPETIRGLAQRFLSIANDPEANAKFPFDAERAADTLFQTANWYEHKPSNAGDIYEASTQADVPRRRRANDNLRAGG